MKRPTLYWLAWSGAGIACIASVVQSFTPLWVFLALITISWLTTGIGVLCITRRAKRAELERKMEKAFGKPKPEPKLKYRSGAQF